MIEQRASRRETLGRPLRAFGPQAHGVAQQPLELLAELDPRRRVVLLVDLLDLAEQVGQTRLPRRALDGVSFIYCCYAAASVPSILMSDALKSITIRT
jgi:hypothetical protein